MSLLRIVSAGAVIVFGVGQGYAQTAKATTGDQTQAVSRMGEPLRVPQITASGPFAAYTATEKSSQVFVVPKTLHTTIRPLQLAQNDGSCYALRTYGFKTNDLESNSPKPSSSTTCTPRTTAMMKSAATK